jgi:small subunit ribosomal protein S18
MVEEQRSAPQERPASPDGGYGPPQRPGGGPGGPRRGGGGRRPRYVPRRKVCYFTVNKIKKIDYKDVELLTRFISDRGKIDPRRKTGTSAKYQRMLSTALKRARHVALLPYTAGHIVESGGVGRRHGPPSGYQRS